MDPEGAEDPLQGFRFQLKTKLMEIRQVADRISEELAGVKQTRKQTRADLHDVEERRCDVLNHRNDGWESALHPLMAESQRLFIELRLADAKKEGLEKRLEQLNRWSENIDAMCQSLAGIRDFARSTYDPEPAVYQRATRALLRLVEEDHDATVEDVLTGPLEQLADAAIAVELAGQRIPENPAAAAEELLHCKRATAGAATEMDRLLFRLSPDILLRDGLVAGLRQLLEGYPVLVHLHVTGEEYKTGGRIELALFRIIEEALNNAVQHSHAENIEVHLNFKADRVLMLITDDGEGFDVNATETLMVQSGMLGLAMMRQRAELDGGTLDIRSTIGVGTEIRAGFPLRTPSRPVQELATVY